MSWWRWGRPRTDLDATPALAAQAAEERKQREADRLSRQVDELAADLRRAFNLKDNGGGPRANGHRGRVV